MTMIVSRAVNQRINLVEHGQTTKISVEIPQNLLVNNVADIENAYVAIQKLSTQVLEISESAFLNKDKLSWDAIQRILYYWNYRDITRISYDTGYVSFVEHVLRKSVLEIEEKYKPSYELESYNDFTPERAVQELADKAKGHRINYHPFLEEMASSGLSQQGTKVFLENYYVNNRLFHLFIAALVFTTPLERRTELANNFYDELGSGDSNLAHPLLFLKNFNSFGRPDTITPLPEALCLANAKTYVACLSDDYHFGMGGFGFIELTMPEQMIKILSGLEKSGIPRQDLEFWDMHITIDQEHGKNWFCEMLQFIKTPQQAQKCLSGGMYLLDSRATMYDGIMRAQ